MKRALTDTELEDVSGGNVTMSAPANLVYFDAIHRVCPIKGNFVEMRTRLLALYDENMDMSDVEFDKLVMRDFRARGWI